NMDVAFDYGFPRCLYGFFTGYFAYRIWRVLPAARMAWIGRLEIPAALAAILFMVYAGDNRASELAPLLFGAIVVIFAFEQGVVSGLLRARSIALLGRHSYSIYMIHVTVSDFLIYFASGLEKVTHH